MLHSTGSVPPHFQQLAFNALQCRHDLDDLDRLLEHSALEENEDILPFFKAHPHLSLFLGQYNTGVTTPDLIAYELELFSYFRADLVVGDWTRKQYCFIEFEDAKPDSIFKVAARRTSQWSDRFESAFSQIVDWSWVLAKAEDNELFERMFGARTIDAFTMIVLGRESGITDQDRPRWNWRRRHVSVYGQSPLCYTFDQLARDLREVLDYGPEVPA